MVGSLPDVITYAKFQVEFFGGYDFTGVEFPIFLLIFEWALQQCSANALPVIVQHQLEGLYPGSRSTHDSTSQ